MPFTQQVRADATGLVVALSGEMDFSVSAPFEETVQRLIAERRPGLIQVDLAGLDFLDSTAVSVIVRLWRLARREHCSLRVIKRGRFKSGEVWAASVRLITSGSLTGGGGTGGFGIKLGTQAFDGAAPISTTTNFGTNLSVFTLYTAQITLDADRDSLVIDLLENGQTGTFWFDDLQLWRVSP